MRDDNLKDITDGVEQHCCLDLFSRVAADDDYLEVVVVEVVEMCCERKNNVDVHVMYVVGSLGQGGFLGF